MILDIHILCILAPVYVSAAFARSASNGRVLILCNRETVIPSCVLRLVLILCKHKIATPSCVLRRASLGYDEAILHHQQYSCNELEQVTHDAYIASITNRECVTHQTQHARENPCFLMTKCCRLIAFFAHLKSCKIEFRTPGTCRHSFGEFLPYSSQAKWKQRDSCVGRKLPLQQQHGSCFTNKQSFRDGSPELRLT
jgi:hypothetical protein